MRMIMRVKLPVEPFNAAVRNGSAPSVMKRIMEEMKAEGAWFSSFDGHRGGILIVDVNDASDIPRLAEPWFLNFDAEVQFHPAITPEDLGRADLESLGKKWG